MSREKAPIVVVNTQEAVVLSKHDRITVDWNAKLQNKQIILVPFSVLE